MVCLPNVKYRVLEGNRIYKVIAILWANDGSIVDIRYKNEENEITSASLENSCLMQSVGFCDKNGKMIFQGDIVSVKHQHGSSMCAVEWCSVKNNFILNPIDNKPKWKPHYRFGGKKGILVVGNIYTEQVAKTDCTIL